MNMLIGFLPSWEACESLLSWWLPCRQLHRPPPPDTPPHLVTKEPGFIDPSVTPEETPLSACAPRGIRDKRYHQQHQNFPRQKFRSV